MALGIYKPGQGYWVRVMTAVGAGLLVLATAGWLWKETTAINLPSKAWDIMLTNPQGAPTPGQVLTAIDYDDEGNPVEMGTIAVESFQASEFRPMVRLVDPSFPDKNFTPNQIDELKSDTFSATVENVRPIPIINPLYVQGSLAGLVLLLGAIGILYYVGLNPKTAEFLIATDGEMKKVNWSTRKEIVGSTWVVIVASVLVATVLFVVDSSFGWFFSAIDVLQK